MSTVSAMAMENHRRRWQVKDFIVSPWRELPGAYTATEIFQLRRAGRFWLASPVLDGEPRDDDAATDSEPEEGDAARRPTPIPG
jgi:hypothetical protein